MKKLRMAIVAASLALTLPLSINAAERPFDAKALANEITQQGEAAQLEIGHSLGIDASWKQQAMLSLREQMQDSTVYASQMASNQ